MPLIPPTTNGRGSSMSKTMFEKPFWLKPPWQTLFDIVKLHKIRPWDLNVSYLLSSFLREMRDRGYIDFAASGSALLSSCIVLRLQSELIMKMEEPPKPPEQKPVEFIPPPLQLPFRYEFTSTSLDNLIGVLEDVMRAELERKHIKAAPIIEPPPDFFKEQDSFFSEIESRIEDFYRELRLGLRGKSAYFTQIVRGKSRQEVIRTFLLLIFLGMLGRVELSQDKEFGEINISLIEEPGTVERPYTI
jgi:segregation and condensation protein A